MREDYGFSTVSLLHQGAMDSSGDTGISHKWVAYAPAPKPNTPITNDFGLKGPVYKNGTDFAKNSIRTAPHGTHDSDQNRVSISYGVSTTGREDIRVKLGNGIAYNVRGNGETVGDLPGITYEEGEVFIKYQIKNIQLNDFTVMENKTVKAMDRVIMERVKYEYDRVFAKGVSLAFDVEFGLAMSLAEMRRLGVVRSDILGIELDIRPEALVVNHVRDPYALHYEDLACKVAEFDSNYLHTYICLVDPNSEAGPLFTNANGLVKQLPVERNSDKEPGLHVYIRDSDNKESKVSYTLDSLTDEVLKGLNLFRSKSECEVGLPGKLITDLSKENKSLKKESKRLGGELNRTKNLLENLREETKLKELMTKHRDTISRQEMSLTKQRTVQESTYDKFKAFALLVTTGLAVYKVFN